ncbi:ABC transporter ATP-binding protein [Treponema primitia]|uniref:ABC transporter ATP-binding protein n=1 Tax=Treponema primitia TaxID=88058 RepID=UPI0002555701|nr:ABC transporter ATP-binding protein [Treponema primitia]
MADYFESEDVVKGYDSGLVRRIMGYIKPYRLLSFAMLFTLALSTLGELGIPVIQQRLIDDSILARSLLLRQDGNSGLSPEAQRSLEQLNNTKRSIAVGTNLFIPQGRSFLAGPSRSITAAAEGELRSAGILDSGQWYAFTLKPDDPAMAVMESRGELFLRGKTPAGAETAAIRTADLYALPVDQIRAVRSRDFSRILLTVTEMFIILTLVFVCTFFQTWTTSLIGQRAMKEMRLALFKKTASQSTAFLSRHPVGRIVTRLTGDVETLNEFFTTVLVAFLKDLSVMIGVLAVLIMLSPKLALVVLLLLPPVLGITAVSRLKARDAFRQQRVASSRVNSYLSERISGIQVVQLFRGGKKSGREFAERNKELLDANLGEMYVFATFRPLVEFLSTLTTAAVIVVGANMVFNLSLSLGVLIAFINLVAMFYAPVMDISEKYTLLQSAMAGGERVFKLLDTDEHIPNTGTHSVEGSIRGDIAFENVQFSYKDGEAILKDLSFTVKAGEMIAIVGYTGAGKTTITNVLARLWDINSGRITLDGIPITDIPLGELRRSVLPVLQDVFLFSGAVADNIRLGLPLTDEQVEEAAKAVHAHEFISRLSEGYQTKLSEGAANISSGQRQLISFARVIAHNPAVVILDEATSSVDTETEHLIQLGLQRVLANRTSIVIAHRLSTIRHANRILVLSGGRLVEQGTHRELIAQNGLYAGLYRLQYEGD